MKTAIFRFTTLLLAGLVALMAPGPALGQERDAYGNPIGYDDPYDDDDQIRQTVARIAEISGRVSYSRGDDPDEWQPASPNVPVTIGDRLYTDRRSRVELQVHGGDFIRLGSGTDLVVLNLTDDTRQFAIKAGVASVRIHRLDDWEVFELDTPNTAITFETPGDYRIDVDPQGYTRVVVRDGQAEVSAGGGTIPIRRGDAIRIDGLEDPRYGFVRVAGADDWDRWVLERETRLSRARSYQYVNDDIAGIYDLDEYGRWDNIPSYGSVWFPTRVAAGWAPYRVGRWIWQDPWGWTWLSAEPWGWAPYHYGRWVTYRGRWCWVPVARRVGYVPYYPALVAFTGGGPGWSASISVSLGGFIGWFPLAPREPLIPWWGRPRVGVSVTNITYINRTYVTVVNQNTFVSGGIVTNSYSRDASVVKQVAAAPVLSGPLPVVPNRGAIRVAAPSSVVASRPPAAIVARSVVARVAPPPAPPRFDQKVEVIRQNRGAPVAPAEAAAMAVRERGRPQAITAVRPVATEPGRVRLERQAVQPGQPAATTAPRPTPAAVAPSRGRQMATAERPVAPAPVAAPRDRGRVRQQSREAAPDSAAEPEGRQPSEARPQVPPTPDIHERSPDRREPAPSREREEEEAKETDRERGGQRAVTPTRERPTEPAARPARIERSAPEPREPVPAPESEDKASDRGRQRVAAPTRPPPSETAAPPARVRPETARQPERPAPQAAPPERSSDPSTAQKPTAAASQQRGARQRPTPADDEEDQKRGKKKEEPTKTPTPVRGRN